MEGTAWKFSLVTVLSGDDLIDPEALDGVLNSTP